MRLVELVAIFLEVEWERSEGTPDQKEVEFGRDEVALVRGGVVYVGTGGGRRGKDAAGAGASVPGGRARRTTN